MISGAAIAVRRLLVQLGFAVGCLFPVRSRIVLATGHDARLRGNLEAIRLAIVAQMPAAAVTSLAHPPGRGLRARVAAAFNAVRDGYELARARLFVVDDYFFPLYVVRPRRETMIVQVWHASGAFKKMGYSLADKTFGSDDALLKLVTIHSNYDLCLVSTRRVAPFYAEAFGQPLDRFTSEIGIPRADPFFDGTWRSRTASIRDRWRIPDGKRVLLYAPTFRGDRVTEAHHVDHLDLEAMREILGEDNVLLLRRHPFVRAPSPLTRTLKGFVIDATGAADIEELMFISDLLITDYSSAIFEFAILERPIAFYAPDLDEYERERGFYFDYRSGVPGPVFTDTRALARWVRDGPFDVDRIRRFRDETYDVRDGRAASRFVDRVVRSALPPVA